MVPIKRFPVSQRALILRINRKLKHEGRHGQSLKKNRSLKSYSDFGEYYIVDFDSNFVVSHHVNPEALGREIGALEKWEYLVQEND